MHTLLKENKTVRQKKNKSEHQDLYLRRKFLIEAPSENSVICNRCRLVYRTETQGTKDQMCVLMFHVPQCYHQRTKTNRREACQAHHLCRFPWPPLLNLMHIAVCAKSQDQSWWLLQQRVEQQFLLRKIFLYHQETDVVLLICMMGCLPVMLSNNFKQLKILS